MFFGCCFLFVVFFVCRGVLFVVCCLFFGVVGCWLSVVWLFVVRCALCFAPCLLLCVSCSLFVVCCLLFVVVVVLFVCCCVVCCLFFKLNVVICSVLVVLRGWSLVVVC